MADTGESMTSGSFYRVIRRLLAQTIILLLLALVVRLVGALAVLSPESSPGDHARWFAGALLHLAMLTGLIGGGLYAIASERAGARIVTPPLCYIAHGWTLLLALMFLAGVLNLPGFAPPLVVMQSALVAAFTLHAARIVTSWTAVPVIWTLGLALSAICSLAALLPVVSELAAALNYTLALTLAALALGFWLMRRFSNVPRGWAERGLYVVAGWLALAALPAAISPLYIAEAGAFVGALGRIGALYLLLAYLVFAAHSYRALSDANTNRTLAAHWYGLAVLLFLLGTGTLGALNAWPEITRWTRATYLSELQRTLTALAIVCVTLAAINQAAAELRGHNRRVTGLIPFWLVTFGALGGGLALAGAGLVQVTLERIPGVSHSETREYVLPLYRFWAAGLASMLLGVVVYALGFYVRRPRLK
jgi:hypothetical protein